MVLGRKTNSSLGETKKTKTKKTRFGKLCGKVQNDVFLVFPRKKLVFLPKTIFSLEKNGFGQENQLFPSFSELVFHAKKEKVGFPAQNHFFLGKRWFWVGKPTFFSGKQQKKDHHVGLWPHSFPKDCFFGKPFFS